MRKEYEIKKIDITDKLIRNPEKIFYTIDSKIYFDEAHQNGGYLEMLCTVNDDRCRFISSETSDKKLTIPPVNQIIQDASSILYAELYDHYSDEKKDVTETIREYYRGTEILDLYFCEYENEHEELGDDDDDDDGCMIIKNAFVLEKIFNIPRKNSLTYSLKIMKL